MHDYGLIHPENLQIWASAQELSGTFMIDPSTLLGVPYTSPWLGIVTIIKKDINNAYGLYIFNYHDSYCCMSNAGKWTEPWVKLTPNKYPSNPNLLDNWYFVNPVNQRGQTEYTTNYAIDRWWLQDSTSLNVVDGGINVIGKWDIEQFFEKALPNGTYTLSLLYKDKTGSDPLRLIAANRSSGDVAQQLTQDASGIICVTFTSDKCDKIVAGFAGSTDNVATFVAVKLELGDTQTLAHKENGVWVLNEIPDFGEQLRRCQRYYYSSMYNSVGESNSLKKEVWATGSSYGSTIHYCEGTRFPVAMRTIPIITIYSGSSREANKISHGTDGTIASVTIDIPFVGPDGFTQLNLVGLDDALNNTQTSFHYTASADL